MSDPCQRRIVPVLRQTVKTGHSKAVRDLNQTDRQAGRKRRRRRFRRPGNSGFFSQTSCDDFLEGSGHFIPFQRSRVGIVQGANVDGLNAQSVETRFQA